MNDETEITIRFGEYKELLVIKGRYEELKEKNNFSPIITSPIVTYDAEWAKRNKDTTKYTLTCNGGNENE